MSSETKFSIQKLNSGNYQIWKFHLEMVLTKDGLWEIVNESIPETKTAEWIKANRQAMATISLSVDDNQLIHIRKCETARDMWLALKNLYERTNLNNKLYLLRKLYKTRLMDGKDMGGHIDSILELVERLRGLGEEIKDNHIAAIMLCSLPETYGPLITSLEGRPESELSVELVKGRLVDEYQRRQENEAHKVRSTDAAFRMGFDDSKERRTKNARTCFHCGKPGHYKRNCRIYKSETGQGNHKAKTTARVDKEGQGKMAEKQDKSGDEYCFSARVNCDVDAWYIDSGATNHMTNNSEFFTEIKYFEEPETVRVADGGQITAHGMGSGKLIGESAHGSGKTIKLSNVLYVPKLDSSLLSVKRLTQLNNVVLFKGAECFISKNDKLLVTASLDNNLYKLNYRNCHQVLKVQQEHNSNCIHMWHRRMGHREPRAIWDLLDKNLVEDIKIVKCPLVQMCDECIRGKMTIKPFPKKTLNRATKPFDLLHSDICGPMRSVTPGGKKYLATITDDCTRYTEVFLLSTKNEVNQVIIDYIQKWSNHFQRKPLIFRSDGGGEFMNEELNKYFKTQGISRQVTVAYSPQQNGVSERRNRSIVEMTRCMLLDAGLSNIYWGEAVNTSVYLQNRLPTKGNSGKSPYEEWFKKKPTLSHIKVFGSKAYIRIPKEKLTKLDERTEVGVLVGYSQEAKGYRILFPETGKIKISRSVVFDETKRNCTDEKCVSDPITSQSKTFEPQIKEEPTHHIELDSSGNVQEVEEFKEPPRRSERLTKGIPAEKLTYKAEYLREPETWSEMMKLNPHERNEWTAAVQEEMESFSNNEVWKLVPLPQGKSAIGSKWIFKHKCDTSGKVIKYKARLVAKGYSQIEGLHYTETYAPVVSYTTLRILLTIAAYKNMKTRHLDMTSAFLNGPLTEELYMQQPVGQEVAGHESWVYRLNRSVYGLKQAAYAWNSEINNVLISEGYKRSTADSCLYGKCEKGIWTHILIYVDDLLICSETEDEIERIYGVLGTKFKTKDLGTVVHYLGINIQRRNKDFVLTQTSKIDSLLKLFGLEDARDSQIPMETDFLRARDGYDRKLPTQDQYRQAVGALLHLSMVTRPDIAAATGFLGRRVSEPTQSDWEGIKKVLKYLKHTKNLGIVLGSDDLELSAYVDSDWAGDAKDRKSTSGYVFKLGKGPICWGSKKQTCVSLSSTEAEYVAAASMCRELLWLQKLLNDFGIHQQNAITVYEDNQSCIKLAEREGYNARSKHIDVKCNIVKDLSAQGVVKFQYCQSGSMIADILTKPLPRLQFMELRDKLNMNTYQLSGGVGKQQIR